MRTFVIGRDAANDIVLDELTVSDRHAELSAQEDGTLVLRDLESTYGTRAHLGIGWRNEAVLPVLLTTRLRLGSFECTVRSLLERAPDAADLLSRDVPDEAEAPKPDRLQDKQLFRKKRAETADNKRSEQATSKPPATNKRRRPPAPPNDKLKPALQPVSMRPPIASRVTAPKRMPWRSLFLVLLILGLVGMGTYWFALRETPSSQLAKACRETQPVATAACGCYANALGKQLDHDTMSILTKITRHPQDQRLWSDAYLSMTLEARRRWVAKVTPLMQQAKTNCKEP